MDDILQNLPIDQLAQELGADPQEVQQAAQTALPALLGGLQANAQDPAGASSIVVVGEGGGGHEDDGFDGARVSDQARRPLPELVSDDGGDDATQVVKLS